MPVNLGIELRATAQHFLKPPLADEAPRTNRVEYNVDMHVYRLALFGIRINDAINRGEIRYPPNLA